MADKLTQRLIAAGASPDRARAFSAQVIAKRTSAAKPVTRTTKKSAGKKPSTGQPPGEGGQSSTSPEEEELAIVRQLFPNRFSPQSLSEEQTRTYFDIVYGKGAWEKYQQQQVLKLMPTYNTAYNSSNQMLQLIAQSAQAGLSRPDAVAKIRNSFLLNPAVGAGLTETDAIKALNTVYDEFDKWNSASLSMAKDGLMELSPEYALDYPDKNLRYGLNTDLSKGIVAYDTFPNIEKFEKQFQEENVKQIKQGISSRLGKSGEVPPMSQLGPLARAAMQTDIGITIPKRLVKQMNTDPIDTPFKADFNQRKSKEVKDIRLKGGLK